MIFLLHHVSFFTDFKSWIWCRKTKLFSTVLKRYLDAICTIVHSDDWHCVFLFLIIIELNDHLAQRHSNLIYMYDHWPFATDAFQLLWVVNTGSQLLGLDSLGPRRILECRTQAFNTRWGFSFKMLACSTLKIMIKLVK